MDSPETEISSTLTPGSITEKKLLFTFNHRLGETYKKLLVSVQPHRGESQPSELSIGINDEQNHLIGFMIGDLIKDQDGITAFSNDLSKNIGIDSLYTPRAVGATIAHIVSSGIIGRWYSAPEKRLSPDAKKMYYKYLAGNKRLVVAPPSAETQFRYVISANKGIL